MAPRRDAMATRQAVDDNADDDYMSESEFKLAPIRLLPPLVAATHMLRIRLGVMIGGNGKG